MLNLRQQKRKKIYYLETIQEFINEFLNLQTKETTRRNYEIAITKYVEFLNQETKNQAITEDNAETNIKLYRSYLQKSHRLASSSIDNYTLRIQAFNSYLGFNTKIKKLNSKKNKSYKYLTIQEIEQLLQTVPQTTKNQELQARNKAIILTLFTAGLRVSELCNLTRNDLIEAEGKTYLLINGKGRAEDEREKIAITTQLKEAINNYLELKEDTENDKPLFTSINNKPLDRKTINKELKKIAAETDERYNTNIKPRCSSHCFRHSLARYLLVDKKQPISLVKDVLRHSSIETTAKYLTNSEEELTELRETIIL